MLLEMKNITCHRVTEAVIVFCESIVARQIRLKSETIAVIFFFFFSSPLVSTHAVSASVSLVVNTALGEDDLKKLSSRKTQGQ